MIRFILCAVLALPLPAADLPALEHDLDNIGRVATVMLDGDLCQRIVTPRAMEKMLHTNPRDKWADADNYDVDDEAFIRTKKMLIRLSNLVDYPADVNLWMPLPGSPARIQIVIRNRHEMSQYWEWGKLYQPMFSDMKQVLDTGRRLTAAKKAGFVSVLAPVKNSLGDVVGLVEVVSRTAVDPRENVK